MRERGNLKDLGVDGMMLLKYFFGWKDVRCIYLVQNREELQAFVNMAMNSRVS